LVVKQGNLLGEMGFLLRCTLNLLGYVVQPRFLLSELLLHGGQFGFSAFQVDHHLLDTGWRIGIGLLPLAQLTQLSDFTLQCRKLLALRVDGVAHLSQFLLPNRKGGFEPLQFVPGWQESLGNAKLK
jgi:hypothetical protein